MKSRNPLLVLLMLVTLLCAVSVTAKSSAAKQRQTDLESIFESSISALGPQEAIESIKGIDAYAECKGPSGAYTTRVLSFGSHKLFIQRTFEYREKPSNLKINGDIGWDTDSDQFSPELISPFSRMVNRLHEFQRMAFDFKSLFSDFELAGEEEFFGSTSFKVKAKSEIGWPAFLYFDKVGKTLSGYTLISPDGEKVTNRFDSWTKVDGVRIPSKVTAIDSKGEWVLDFESIRFNTIREDIFDIPRPVSDMSELLRLHKQAQTAHLTYDAELFISMFGENLTQIQSGEVVTRNKKTNLASFKEYFRTFKFEAWENIAPPVINISKDGTLATVQVQKRVTGDYTDEAGKVHRSETIFAWLEVWEKIDGKWKVVTVASTRKQ